MRATSSTGVLVFQWLADWFEWLVELLKFWSIVDQYEEGVLLRLGRYKRSLTPGLVWHLPLYLDRVLTDNVVPTTLNLDEQILTSLGGQTLVISIMIRWRIHDIRKILLEVEDAEEVLADCSMGELARSVQNSESREIMSADWIDTLYRRIRRRGWAWGIEVQEVQVTDLAPAKVLRVVQ